MKLSKGFISFHITGNMKKIEAVIRSSVLHDIQNDLQLGGIPTFSVYQIQITGIHKSHEGLKSKTSDLIPKVKIEILCVDKDEERIITTIQKSAKTGEKGDGVIFSYKIDNLVKIRTGEKDIAALN